MAYFDDSSSDSSNSEDSSIIELRIGTSNMLPNTSSLSSQSSDGHVSDEEEELEEEAEIEKYEDLEDESVLASTRKRTNKSEDGEHFATARKILSVMQGRLVECLLPHLNSPPHETQDTFW